MDFYRKHIEEATQVLATLKRKINLLALSRLGVILLGGVILFNMVQTESIWGVVLVFFAVIILFAGLVYRQSMWERQRRRWQAFERINQNELDLQADHAANLYDHGGAYANPNHPYSDDLDIYGAASLYAFVNRCATPQGRKLMAAWLGGPATVDQIRTRQDAVSELAADPKWAQQFQVDLFPAIHDRRDLQALLKQYIGEGRLRFGNRWLRSYVRVAPLLVSGLLIGSFWLPSLLSLGVWLMVANFLATLGAGGQVTRIVGRADKAGSLLNNFSEAINRIESRTWQTEGTRRLSQPLGGSHAPLSVVFKRLSVLLDRLDYRLNMIVGALLNMFFVWDFRQVFELQDWQQAHGNEVLQALDVVAEFEVLNSLAILRMNHPHWAIPRVFESAERQLTFTEMAHPLIPVTQAIANDYTKEDHRIALITGSNMAGKSTFLRTAGVNIVLALCGAPVCARSMDVSVLHLLTYMRIKDSLQESTSTFKAELDRMKLILTTVNEQPYSFLLIDEMLRGTNSVDKYRGSKAIIERLIRDGAMGMVATHDLQLASLEEQHGDAIRNYHFDIQVRDGEMQFDYKLKQGPCAVFNASILLRGIGIEVDPPSTAI